MSSAIAAISARRVGHVGRRDDVGGRRQHDYVSFRVCEEVSQMSDQRCLAGTGSTRDHNVEPVSKRPDCPNFRPGLVEAAACLCWWIRFGPGLERHRRKST